MVEQGTENPCVTGSIPVRGKTAGFTGVRCAYVVIPKELMGYTKQRKKKFLSMDYGKEEVVANLMEYRILRKEVQRLFIQKKDKKGLKKILDIIKKMQNY